MDRARKNVGVLVACQALLFTNNSILTTVNGLAGLALAPQKVLATLPVTAYIVGATLTTIPVSLLMRRIGRRGGFTVGALIGILGALICALAVHAGVFWLLCAGSLVLGTYNAAGQYYRFAAADAANEDFKSRAISFVIAGGIFGGILGPETSKLTKDLVAPAFLASYLSLVAFCLLAVLLLRFIEIPPLSQSERKEQGRPLTEIARQPAFVVAVLSAMVGYGVMNLLMTAAPLAIVACQLPFSDAAFVIQWHFIAMFAPSLVTGALIRRFGVITIMLAGVALNFASVGFALSGLEVAHFWLALVCVGTGWNFMFIGGTTLLTETHTPAERAKTQGVNDFAIFLTMAITSAVSGALFTLQGWELMNLGALPVLALTGAVMIWLAVQRRRTLQAAS
jgi:MFS family permease